MKRFFQSLRARLNFWVLVLSMAIFGSIAVVFHVYSYGRERQAAVNYNHLRLDNMAMNIEQKVRNVEYSVQKTLPIIEDHLDNPDELSAIVEQWVRDDSLVMGGSIAFEPYYYPNRGKWFMPYVFIDSDEHAICKQLGSDRYDYHHKEWYASAKASRGGIWSEPYFDDGGGQTFMVTYAYPLRDNHDNVYAVITADVALSQLTQVVHSLQLYSDSRTFLATSRGTFLSHWREDMECNANVNQFADSINSKNARKLAAEIMAGREGTMNIELKGPDELAFYTTVPKVGWRLCTFCSYTSIMGELRTTAFTVLAIFIVGLILLSILVRFLLRHEMLPLEHLAEAARQIGCGDFNVELPNIEGRDELRSIRDSFATMQQSLTEYIAELKDVMASKQRIESELHIAHDLQMNMLPCVFPPFPDRKEIDLYATIIPAKEVGGDLYDFFIRDDKLFFAVGDVSGKGFAASLFMVITKTIFRMVAATTFSPAMIAKQLNTAIAADNESSMFVTMFIGVVDLKSGMMAFCNAGHNPPLLMHGNERPSFLSVISNLPIGIIGDFDYKEQVADISSLGLLVYTDGVTEAENADRNLFGDEQLMNVCEKLNGNTSSYIIKGIVDAVHRHAGKANQSDDITLLCLSLSLAQQTSQPHSSLLVKNNLSEMDKLPDFLENFATANNIDPTLVSTINLALEEAMVNVINYAYPSGVEGDIWLTARAVDNMQFVFTLTDSGKPFDPTSVPDADTASPAEERSIGGLGILLTRRLMDTVSYERKDNKNILTMTKQIK